MKYLIIVLAVVLFVSCKTSAQIESKTEEPSQTKYMDNPWTRQDFRPAKELVLPNNYTTYLLDKPSFDQQLTRGEIYLPKSDGSFASYSVKKSATMSEELQAKFPNIKSYEGVETGNSLCHVRIDQKSDKFKITVLCNDATFFIQDLHDLGIYFIYNKKDLPDEVGTVNE